MSVHNDTEITSQVRCEGMQRKLNGRRAAIMGAALAALAILACVFLLIAHNVPLGPLNSLVSEASVKWLYLGVGLGGAAFLGNLAVIYKRTKKRTIESETTLLSLKLPDSTQSNSTFTPRPNSPYRPFDVQSVEPIPAEQSAKPKSTRYQIT